MDAVQGEATHQVVGGPRGVDEKLYVNLRRQEGIRNIAPVIDALVDVNGSTLRLLGMDVFAEREFRSFAAPYDGERQVDGTAQRRDNGMRLVQRLLTDPGAALMSEATASRLGLSIGTEFEVRADGRSHPAFVADLLGDADEQRLDSLMVVDLATAQEWLDRIGRLSRIDVRAPPDARPELERIQAHLPDEVQLLSAEGRTQAVRDMSEAFMTNLTAMSLLALLVGVFLIYNSVSFAVLQRRNLLGVLRALGCTRNQTFRLIMIEAFILGTVGALLGLLGGAWLGERLLALVSRSINDLYFVVNVTDVTIGLPSLAKGFVAGLGATLVAAALPAMEAAASQPRLTLARSMLEQRSRSLLPAIAVAGAVTAVFAAVLLATSGRSLVAGLVSVFLLVLGCALVIPLFVRIVVGVAAPVAGDWAGTPARMAVAGVAASLSRTAVAIVALAIAVSATVGVTVMVDSFRSAVAQWIDQSLRADLYVGVGQGSLDRFLIGDLVAVDGVESHSNSRRIWLESESARIRVTALELPPAGYAGLQLLEGNPETAWPAFDLGGAILVSDAFAWRNEIGPGDAVSLPTKDGEREFPVVATYRSYDSEPDALIMSRRTYDRFWDDPEITSIGLYLADGASGDAVAERLREISQGRQSLVVRSNRDLRTLSMQVFDRTFVITDVLYWLAIGVAFVGILGAMLALQLDRSREHAVLRALGMTPRQLGGMVSGQAAFMGCLSGVAAIPLGLIMAWVLVKVINRRAFGWQMDLVLAPEVLAGAMALATAAGFIAGLYPAWRAARSLPAHAIRDE
jgi:putative ABC transport system permease protein